MVNQKWLSSFMQAQKAVLAKVRLPAQLKAAPQAAVDLVRGPASRRGMQLFAHLPPKGVVRNYEIVDANRQAVARFRVAEKVGNKGSRYSNYIHSHPAPVAPIFKKYNLTIPKLIGKKNTRRIARQFLEMHHGVEHGSGSYFSRTGTHTLKQDLRPEGVISMRGELPTSLVNSLPSRKTLIMGKRGVRLGAHKEY